MNSVDFVTLGDEAKQFESMGTSLKFPPGGLLMARLDGNSFHTFTRGMEKPFDKKMTSTMVEVTKRLCEHFHCALGYTQSDEITLVWDLTKPKKPGTIFPFDGKAAKLNSILAGFTAVQFNQLFNEDGAREAQKIALFDCRVWPIPDRNSAVRTLMWRQWDAEKNSVNSLASCHYSPSQLHGRSTKERLSMLDKSGVRWSELHDGLKRGTFVLPTVKRVQLEESLRINIPEPHRPEPGAFVDRKIYQMDYPRLLSMSDETTCSLYLFGE